MSVPDNMMNRASGFDKDSRQLAQRLALHGCAEIGLGCFCVPGQAAVQPVRRGQVNVEIDSAQRHAIIVTAAAATGGRPALAA